MFIDAAMQYRGCLQAKRESGLTSVRLRDIVPVSNHTVTAICRFYWNITCLLEDIRKQKEGYLK